MEYCSATKRNEVLTHATTWVNLNGIMLNEKENLKRLHTVCSIYISHLNEKIIVVEDISVVARV